MTLAKLSIHHLRNIASLTFSPHAHINLISGANGSGKTTFLEAIYLLGTGHSFRTRETPSLVSHGSDEFILFAKANESTRISLSKSLVSPTTVKINGKPCQSSSELARLLPTQVFYQDIFNIIDAGPGIRRSVLDWGLFHVKRDYHRLLKEYKQTLKQRNALLRTQAAPAHFVPWDNMLADFAEQIHALRMQYLSELNAAFRQVLLKFSDMEVTLNYHKGWDRKNEGKSLADTFKESLANDLKRQYTMYGAHNADLVFTLNARIAKSMLSRGQQKIALFALKFAQALLLQKPCVYLIDDIHSELDKTHLSRLIEYIKDLKGQFFITFHTDDPLTTSFDGGYNHLNMDTYECFT